MKMLTNYVLKKIQNEKKNRIRSSSNKKKTTKFRKKTKKQLKFENHKMFFI